MIDSKNLFEVNASSAYIFCNRMGNSKCQHKKLHTEGTFNCTGSDLNILPLPFIKQPQGKNSY